MSEESQQRIFAGESRELLVSGLQDLYKTCSEESHEPMWVSLEAPSGWGKTRVGLEFYERLAATQTANDEPAYWPDSIVDTELGRKATRPRDFVRPAYSLPQYMWLGITCSHREGLVSEAWREDIQQLECHLLFLEAAYRARTDVKERWGEALLAKRKELAGLTITELVSQAAGALEVAFPGMGLAKEAAAFAGKTIQERIKERKEIARESKMGIPDKSGEVEHVVNYLARISKTALPVVLLVEDIHRADAMLYDFIDALMQRGGSVLIISTIWPEKATVATSPKLIELFDKHSERLHRVAESAPVPPFEEGAGLIELEEEARKEILRSKFPNVDEDTAKSLLDRYVSPLALEAFCKIEYWHSCFPDGDLQLDPEDIDELPGGLFDIYCSLWSQMSLTEQATLAVGWHLSPENINAAVAPGERRWSHPVLRDVMLSLTLSDRIHEEIAGTLSAQDEPGAWIRATDEYLRAFLEPLQSQVVELRQRSLLRQDLSGNDRTTVLQALASRLVDGSDEVRIGNTSRAVLALYRESYVSNHQVVAQAVDALLNDLIGNSMEFAERDRLWKLYLELDHDQVPDDVRFAICRKQAAKLVEEDMPFLAVELYASLVEEMIDSDSFGPLHQETLDVRHDMAVGQCDMGRYEEGLLALGVIVRDMRTVWGASDPATLRAEMSLAWHHLDEGHFTDALTRLIESSEPNSPSVCDARRSLISLYSNRRRYDKAIEQCDGLLIDMKETFHSTHDEIFEMKKLKASLLDFDGQSSESITCSESILEEMKGLLDPEHPTVLEARSDLIYKLEHAEEPSNTLAMAEELVADATRVLGADHPIYRRAEQKRIDALMSLERFDDAIPASEKLLAQVLDSPGAEDLAGSYARNWHMFNLWGAGRYEEAIAAHADALEVEVQQLGPDHRRIFVMRGELVELLYDAGEIEKALAESTRLVNEARDQLDADDEIIEAAVERKTRIESSLPQ